MGQGSTHQEAMANTRARASDRTCVLDAQGHFLAGTALMHLGRPRDAVAAFKAGVAVEPMCVCVSFNSPASVWLLHGPPHA
jgi:hypothetical protein